MNDLSSQFTNLKVVSLSKSAAAIPYRFGDVQTNQTVLDEVCERGIVAWDVRMICKDEICEELAGVMGET